MGFFTLFETKMYDYYLETYGHPHAMMGLAGNLLGYWWGELPEDTLPGDFLELSEDYARSLNVVVNKFV